MRASCRSPGIQMPRGGAALWAAEPKTKGTTFVVPFVFPVLIKKMQVPQKEKPAFWPAALLRRKFGAAGGGGELRRGGFADPEH